MRDLPGHERGMSDPCRSRKGNERKFGLMFEMETNIKQIPTSVGMKTKNY